MYVCDKKKMTPPTEFDFVQNATVVRFGDQTTVTVHDVPLCDEVYRIIYSRTILPVFGDDHSVMHSITVIAPAGILEDILFTWCFYENEPPETPSKDWIQVYSREARNVNDDVERFLHLKYFLQPIFETELPKVLGEPIGKVDINRVMDAPHRVLVKIAFVYN